MKHHFFTHWITCLAHKPTTTDAIWIPMHGGAHPISYHAASTIRPYAFLAAQRLTNVLRVLTRKYFPFCSSQWTGKQGSSFYPTHRWNELRNLLWLFAVTRIWTHSIRSGEAMAMFLAGVPAETIQLVGRWRSHAFLRYIRVQVQQLTRGVTTTLTRNPEFLTIGQGWLQRTKLAVPRMDYREKETTKGKRIH